MVAHRAAPHVEVQRGPWSKRVANARFSFGQVRWLLYQGVVLANAMGLGVRWVWMLMRTLAFGIFLLNGFLRMIWWYLTSPFILRRIRYSDALVASTPIRLQPPFTRGSASGRRWAPNASVRAAQGTSQLITQQASNPMAAEKSGRWNASIFGKTLPSFNFTLRSRKGSAGEAASSPAGVLSPASGSGSSRNRGNSKWARQSPPSTPTTPATPVSEDGRDRSGDGLMNRSLNNIHNEETLNVTRYSETEEIEMGLNNRAFLDIHFPVTVDSFLGKQGATLAAALPPVPKEEMSPDDREANESVRHMRVPSADARGGGTNGHRLAHRRAAAAAARMKGPASPSNVVHGYPCPHASKAVGLRHARDIVVPPTITVKGATPEETRVLFPVIICVTGGAWIIGVHFWMAMMARILSACGFIVVTPDYRNFPSAVIPDMVDDVDAAIEWTVRNIERFHGDPNRIYLLGQSAGAHLCTLSMLRQASALQTLSDNERQRRDHKAEDGGSGSPLHPDSSGTTHRPNFDLTINSVIEGGSREKLDISSSPLPYQYNPRKHIRAFIGLSGMYDLDGMADYLHSRGLYRGVLKRMCAHDIQGCSALVQLQQADSEALANYFPLLVLFAHGNCDTSSPLSESAHMAAVLRSKLAEMSTDPRTPISTTVPAVRLHVLAGATHTTPMVEDFLAGRSEIASILLAVAKQDYMNDTKTDSGHVLTPPQAPMSSAPSSGPVTPSKQKASFSRVMVGSPQVGPHSNGSTTAPTDLVDRATLEASFVGGAGSVSFSAKTIAAVHATLMANAEPPSLAHTHSSHHGSIPHPVVKFRPLCWRWQANLASFVSAF
jgi:acetyl esterase/lipase